MIWSKGGEENMMTIALAVISIGVAIILTQVDWNEYNKAQCPTDFEGQKCFKYSDGFLSGDHRVSCERDDWDYYYNRTQYWNGTTRTCVRDWGKYYDY